MQINSKEVGDLVAAALNDGRLLSAQKDWAERLGKTDLVALKSFLDSAQPIAGLNNSQTGGKEPEGSDHGHSLSETDTAACKALGVDAEAFKNTLAQES